jgi:hypothetical protein
MTTKEAVDHLCVALQGDPSYAVTWQANIAMPILDGCKRRGLALSHADANALADDLMQHLFGVRRQVAPVYRPLTGSDVIVPGDEFKLRSLSDEHWGPCELFTDSKVSDVHEKGRIEFRRRI